MKCIVNTSGGASSAVALYRAIQRYPGKVVSLFCDTKMEDPDLYRFLNDIDVRLGIQTTHLVDGRNIWDVAFDERYMPNGRIDPCSKLLKREPVRKWLKRNYKQGDILVYGFHAGEIVRAEKLKKLVVADGRQVWFPLIDDPEVFPQDAIEIVESLGVKVPVLYEHGFQHNNCGGFCFKEGQGQFARLLSYDRERYLFHENKERQLRRYLQKDVAILKKMKNGVKGFMTMEAFRKQIDAGMGYDENDIGTACNCMGVQDPQNKCESNDE